MGRTNIEIDDELIGRAMDLYGARTKREAVELALRRLVGEGNHAGMLRLRGSGWSGDLDELRAEREE